MAHCEESRAIVARSVLRLDAAATARTRAVDGVRDTPRARRSVRPARRRRRRTGSAERRPPHRAVRQRVRLGMSRDAPQARVDGAQERLSKSWQLRLIPGEGLVEIGLGARPESQREHQRGRLRMRSRTSSQGAPPAGSASASASRRSRSARCASLSGKGSRSQSAAMLSQSSSTSSNRSDSDSLRSSSRRAAFVMTRRVPPSPRAARPASLRRHCGGRFLAQPWLARRQ